MVSSLTSPSKATAPFPHIATPGDLPELARSIEKWPAVVLDCETTGLEPYLGSQVLGFGCCSLAAPDEVWYVPVAHGEQPCRDLTPLWQAFKGKPFVNHNVKFDMHFLTRLGFPYGEERLFDTMVMARLLEEEQYAELGLKEQAKKQLGYVYRKQEVVRQRAKIKEIRMEDAAEYCAEDVWATARLYEHYKGKLDSQLRALFSQESQVSRALFGMERRGWRYDPEYTGFLNAQLPVLIQRLETELRALVGDPNFNPASSPQVCAVMAKLGIKPRAWGKERKDGKPRQPSWGREVLQQIEHPVAWKLCQIHSLEHLTTGLLATINQYQGFGDSCIHMTYKNWGTVTGRLSSLAPNMQNLNKGWLQFGAEGNELNWSEEGPDFTYSLRKLFAPRPGYVLVVADYRQIEMFMLALYTRDPVLRKLVESEDVHAAVAMDVWKATSADPNWKELRHRGKILNFAVIYGVGVPALAKQLGSTAQEAFDFKQEYFSRIKGYQPFVARVRRQLEDQGFSRSLYGRIYAQVPEYTYKIVNYLCQGTAGDYVKFRIGAIQDWCAEHGIRLWGTTHDDIVMEWPESELGMIPELVQQLENAPGFPMRLPVKVEVGRKNLAELEAWNAA